VKNNGYQRNHIRILEEVAKLVEAGFEFVCDTGWLLVVEENKVTARNA